jgi:asparagine synthase (glutamine-hydrolysing)
MCGIFAFLLTKHYKPSDDSTVEVHDVSETPIPQSIYTNSNKIVHRGPTNTKSKYISTHKKELLMVFHRLAINGLEASGDQPFSMRNVSLICNGEIYNYKKLLEENPEFKPLYKSNSDCEIIIHMYRKYGMMNTLKQLDGEFAFVLYDNDNDNLYAARDPVGVRSLFYGTNYVPSNYKTPLNFRNSLSSNSSVYSINHNHSMAFASEAKAILMMREVKQFPSGCFYNYDDDVFERYYSFDFKLNLSLTEDQIYDKLYELLVKAVDKRLMSDVDICCLLSGGLDSTLVTLIAADLIRKKSPKSDKIIDTYSIGFEGSVDLKFAKIASDFIKTNHHEVIITEDDGIAAIEETIKQIESFCTTSVRASIMNLLVCKRGVAKSINKVVLCGDMSDEIFASYRGFQKADTPENFFLWNIVMVKNVQFFDMLRACKSISYSGLEARVPFADKELMDFAMSIDPSLKMFTDDRMEKYLLRKAFDNYRYNSSFDENVINPNKKYYLPDELLWRRKEAFSDGVSAHERSWFTVIREHVDKIYSDEDFEKKSRMYTHCPPYDKESLYYREIFEKHYPGRAELIPYFWRHPFTTQLDPSARCLDFYKA